MRKLRILGLQLITNWEAIMAKVKSIDLGALQSEYTTAKKEMLAAKKNLEKAQVAFDTANKSFQTAYEALKGASRTVLE